MTVLVLGATGVVGPHVVRALVARGVPTRVLTRNVGHATEVLPAGVDIRAGDPAQDADVVAAAHGVDALFLLSSHGHEMADLQLRVIRALRRVPIPIVKLSGTSPAITAAGPQACRQHWEVEQVLAATGQPHVVLRPNSFMQTLIDRIMLPALEATGAIPNPIGTAGISLIDAQDVGECAAEALVDPRWLGQTLALTGPRSVTYPQIAEILSRTAGSPVATHDITPAEVRRSLEDRGTAAWEAEHFEEMYVLFREGRSEHVTDTVQQMLGRPAASVEDHLAAYGRATRSEGATA